MIDTRIVTVAKELPRYCRSTEEIIPFINIWLASEDERFRRKVVKIFEGAAVDKRYGIMNIEEVFTATSFEDKNAIYIREIKKLGKAVLRKALAQSGWESDSLDYIITVSCTGYHDSVIGCLFNQRFGIKTRCGSPSGD